MRLGLATRLLVATMIGSTGFASVAVSASAEEAAPDPTAQAAPELAAAYLDAHPGGTIVEDAVVYPDGTTFLAVPIGTLSVSQCPSNRFCIWGSANYSGSLVTKSGDGSTLSISSSVYSVWNNRSYAARLYNSDGSASICLAAGAKKPTVAAAYHAASKVRLLTSGSC